MLPISKLPPFQHCDCPDWVETQYRYERWEQLYKPSRHKNATNHPPPKQRPEESKPLQGIIRRNPTGKAQRGGCNSVYCNSPKIVKLIIVHFPWSRMGKQLRRPIDAISLQQRRRRRAANHSGGICRLHFTLNNDAINRFVKYYPVVPMQSLKLEFFETYQGIPVQLGELQIENAARDLGIRKKRPGYELKKPPPDVYTGLPPEMDPETPRATPQKSSRDILILDQTLTPPPIFPTSDQVEIFQKLLAIAAPNLAGV